MKIFFPSYLVLGVLASLIASSAQAQLAVQGETVHTMAGDVLHDAIVLIKGGKIEAVGTKTNLRIPDGYKVVSARVVVPGLIDAHTTVGVSGLLNQNHDQEQLDKTGPMQPELRAVDSYNSLDPLVDFVRSLGITTLHTGHGPGALISGQTFVVKTAPSTLDHATLNAATTLACTFGPGALNMGKDKAPGTVSKAMAMLRAELIKASEYKEKLTKTDAEKHPSRDLRLETLQRALEGKQPLMITVQRHQDILAVLRLAAEFKLKIILDGVADAALVIKEIKASGFPVILHPTLARPSEELENLSFETAAKLQKEGILFALQSGFESYVPKTRIVLFEAAAAAANGLTFAEALASITINPAKILGLTERVGSIAPGKDADLALYDGDPFEYTTHCVGTVISGVLESGQPR